MWKNVLYAFIAIIVYISRNIHSHRSASKPQDFNASSKAILAAHGHKTINELLIVKRPISSILEKAMRTISFGFYDRALNALKIQSLNHISLIVSLDDPATGQRKYISIEKNHTAFLAEHRFSPSSTYYILGHLKEPLTLQAAIDTIRAGDADLFAYDMFDNNCQTFVRKALQSLNVSCPSSLQLDQDICEFYGEMPAYVSAVSKCFLEVRHSIKNYIDAVLGPAVAPVAPALAQEE